MNIRIAKWHKDDSRVLIDEEYSGMVYPSHKTGYAYCWLTYEKELHRRGHTIAEVKPLLAKLLGVDENEIEVSKL